MEPTQALEDLLALLTIDGPPGNEAAVAAHLRRVLLEIGCPPSAIATDAAAGQSEIGGDTGNLIVRLDGHGEGERWMLSAHMDTVPGAVGTRPRQDGDLLVSDVAGKALGGDNRAGCAVLLQVARALLARQGQHRPVTLAFFVQEEIGLVGARGLDLDALGTPRPAYCLNFDGGAPDELVTAVIGTERFHIHVDGLAAHAGARPEQGVSAATVAALAIAQLQRDGWNGRIRRPEGAGSANIGTIEGGTGTNVVMPGLHILAEARSHDGSFRRAIIDAWQSAFAAAAAAIVSSEGATGAVRFAPGPAYEAFRLDDEAPIVRAIEAAADRCGVPTRRVTNDGGMDANWIVAHGIPAVTLGVGQRHAHTPQEELDLRRFGTACRIATALVA